MIVPIHNHSMYSALDGLSTPEEIAKRVKGLGCPCCGLTDHGVVSGHLHFAKALKEEGIKPVFGCELYHGLVANPTARDQAHLVALAMTDEGLRNLWSLVNATAQADHFYNVGRVFWHDLKKYREGLAVTSACALGLVPKHLIQGDIDPLNRYLDIFGDNFYIEIHTYPIDKLFDDRDAEGEPLNMRTINEALVAIAWERGIPLVYANDAHYAYPEQAPYHDLYIASQTKQSIHTPIEERKQWHPPGALSIMSEDEVRKALEYLPQSAVDEAINNSVLLGEKAQAQLPEVKRHLPVFVPSDCPWLDERQQSLSAENLFEELVESGTIKRYGEDASEEVWDRAVYEAETLVRDGIHHYFLMGWDEMQAARDQGIETGPGRGSSAGCLVSYALDITDVDPLHYGLIFERFWNSGRAKGFPDIDSDFSRAQRDAVIAYLENRWGKDRVCAIGTTGYLKPKAAIDKLRKGCGIEYEEAEALKKIVGETTKIDILGHEQVGWTKRLEPGKKYYVEDCVGEEIKAWIAADPAREFLREQYVRMCEVCCSRVEQYGIHASGILIADCPTESEVPAYRRGGKVKGKPATMFTMSDVDDRMFIKLDVLGLRTLDVLEYWRQMMAEKGIDIKWSGLDLEEHDSEMWDMLKDGYTAGIFQVEDGYGRQLCKGMEPRNVEDLAALVALNRPGPIQAKIPDEYIARRRGDKPIDYLHPRMEELIGDILDPTYGLFVYQEQIIAFFNALGYTKSESDGIRKIMGKKKPEQMDAVRDGKDEWTDRGYLTMAVGAGLPLEVAQEVWDELEGFADYCFNKSHAVAYAIIGFRTLFAKYYGPGAFFAACLRSLDHSRDSDKRKTMVPQYVNECRRLNIEIAPPDIEKSRAYAHVDDEGVLRFGFYDVKGVGNSGPYIEYLVQQKGLNTQSAYHFANDFDIFNEKFAVLKKEKVKSGEWENPREHKSPKQMLQANKIDALVNVGAFDNDMTMSERQKVELEYLGVIVTDNTTEVLERNAEEISYCDPWDRLLIPYWPKADDESQTFTYKVCGIVTGISEKKAKKSGKSFGIVTLEFGSDSLEMSVFSNKWKSHKFLFKPRTVGVFTIKHSAPTQYGESYRFEKGFKLQ